MIPLISICVPVYGKPLFVTRLLNSILTQEHKHIEIILSDDTPDDSVKKVAEAYNPKMTIRYFQHIPSLKSPRNWNFALDQAQGDYTMLIHQDDWLHHPSALTMYVEAFTQNPTIGFVFCKNTAIKPSGEAIVLQTFPWLLTSIQNNPYHLVRSDVIGPPSNVMVRKGVNIRYDEEMIWLVDVDYYVRLIESGLIYTYIDKHLVSIGLHEDQMTNFCRENSSIMVKENLFFAYKNQTKLFSDWRLFDYFWRLLRNHAIIGEDQLWNAGVPKERVVTDIKRMLRWQKPFSLKLLRVGIFSKLVMYACFITRKS